MTTLTMYAYRYDKVVPVKVSFQLTETPNEIQGLNHYNQMNGLDLLSQLADFLGYDWFQHKGHRWTLYADKETSLDYNDFSYSLFAAFLKETGQIDADIEGTVFCAGAYNTHMSVTSDDKAFIMQAFRDGFRKVIVAEDARAKLNGDPDIAGMISEGLHLAFASKLKRIDRNVIICSHPKEMSNCYRKDWIFFPYRDDSSAKERLLTEINYRINGHLCGDYPDSPQERMNVILSQMDEDGMSWTSSNGSVLKLILHQKDKEYVYEPDKFSCCRTHFRPIDPLTRKFGYVFNCQKQTILEQF